MEFQDALSPTPTPVQFETVRDVLVRKGRGVWTIAPEATVYDAIAMMDERRVGALIVVQQGRVAGVISERDYARKVILKGRSSRDTLVGEIMTADVISAREDARVDECLQRMTLHRIRHLPVLDGEQLAGLVSIGDLVSSVLRSQAAAVEHLTSYVTGSYPR